ncbi:MAG: DUF3465 domain-containing protein [Thermoanaerobaculia bacterium]|nr:DUF3465 domain-containing protein [Thermoanaerobaculia bacterium]
MSRPLLRLVSVAVFAAVLLAGWLLRDGGFSPAPSEPSASTAVLDRAFAERRSNLWVTVTAPVERLLPDDRKGNPHQRFLLRLPSGLTVLVAHNIELAERVPLTVGDTVEIRGEYEWNDKGGVLHWTHHDPSGRRDGGHIRYDGRVYR